MEIDPSGLDARQSHELMVGCITPRPIALVSTIGEDGIYNVAPFSFFTMLSLHPTIVGFSIGRKRDGSKKDTLLNIEVSRDFVVNIVPENMAQEMNRTSASYPHHIDEFKEAGLTPLPSKLVSSPRVTESPIQMECRLMQVLEYGTLPRIHNFIVGEVLRIHVQDALMENGAIRSEKLKTIGRMGGNFYCRTGDLFEMQRPIVQGTRHEK
jgi:flavin reductase (DIM6/NTAB) family NADH-FMN oxidoreductase RutF